MICLLTRGRLGSVKKSQHGCVRWALCELHALYEHLTCNHAMISPAAALRKVFESILYMGSKVKGGTDGITNILYQRTH